MPSQKLVKTRRWDRSHPHSAKSAFQPIYYANPLRIQWKKIHVLKINIFFIRRYHGHNVEFISEEEEEEEEEENVGEASIKLALHESRQTAS